VACSCRGPDTEISTDGDMMEYNVGGVRPVFG
jgi:hypothetical protein